MITNGILIAKNTIVNISYHKTIQVFENKLRLTDKDNRPQELDLEETDKSITEISLSKGTKATIVLSLE